MAETTPAAPVTVTVADRRIRTPAELAARMALADQLRPFDYQKDMTDLRHQYEGRIRQQMLAAAAKRFPQTAPYMPETPFNWIESIAEKVATIYDEPPIRNLVDLDEKVVEDTPGAKAFAATCKASKLSVVMPEADRVRAVAGSCYLSIRTDTLAGMARRRKTPPVVVDLLWSNDVWVVPHPQAPTDLQAALEVLIRTSGDPACQTFLHWMHDVAVDANGNTIGFGSWRSEILRMTRRQASALAIMGGAAPSTFKVETQPHWDPYPLPTLPLVVFNNGIPAGYPAVDFRRNLVSIANTINASLMSEVYTGDMTAAPILVHKTKQPQPATTTIGPGVKANILPEETLESIAQTADLEGLRATNEALADNLATTMQQPRGAFTGDDGAESGVALKVKSIPATRQRRKLKEITRPIEEEEFLPELAAVSDYFTGTKIMAEATGGFRVTFPDPPDFETPAEKQSRELEMEQAGGISLARVAVDCGYYKTEADAQAAIDGLADERAEKMGGALLAANAPPDGTGDDGDPAADDTADAPVDDASSTGKAPPPGKRPQPAR